MAPSSRFFNPVDEASSMPCKTEQVGSTDLKRVRLSKGELALIRPFPVLYLVSLSAASMWRSWAKLSTNKESQSQTGCTVLL